MKNYLFTFRSVTYAQKGERILRRSGIDCVIRRTPKAITNKACGYCLQVRAQDLTRALELMQNSQAEFGRIYGVNYEGNFEELTL